MSFSDTQRQILAARGISEQAATAAGVRSISKESDLPAGCPDYWTVEAGYLPGLLFRWDSPDGATVAYQLRPDVPVVGKDGDTKKYVFGPGALSILHRATPEHRHADTTLIVEGTCQTIAAAIYAPDDVDVYGIAGCRSWSKDGIPTSDLGVVSGRDVLVALDADAASNAEVYAAGVALREACLAEGATSVRFLRVPGGGKTGLDDVLGGKPDDVRAAYLANLIEIAQNRPKGEKPEAPSATRPKSKAVATAGPMTPYFSGTKLLVKALAVDIVRNRPAAITADRKIALYRDGVYRIDGLGFTTEVTELLGDDYREGHERNAEKFTLGQLNKIGAFLPENVSEPLLNCSNTMVDLRTGEAVEHDPKYRSISQIPVEWIPGATAPLYEEWAAEQIGDQLDDLEESVAVMLDPTITPTKAAFLFGPSRSGKSTFLRLMREIAGPENVSGVSLHQLAENRFMSANLYGKTLNVAADLSSAHVEDISLFKMMTGEDLIQADRKYGGTFSFVNRALFLFSANELPTVGESSRAYSERIKPFHFARSFAGYEDPALEAKLRDELPGILVRLVRAHQRRTARGTVLPTNPAVRDLFEQASDRVRQFVAEACEVVEVTTGKGGSVGGSLATTSELYNAFREWANDEGKAGMAKSKMKARLATVPGVVENISSGKSRGWNVRIRPRKEWSSGGTLSVPALKRDPRARESSDGVDLAEETTVVGPSYGAKRTKFRDPADEVAAFFPSPAVPECPDCDGPEELVPPANFWFACRRCHPGTFTRG